MPYERGMSIGLDNRKCIIHFRGHRYDLHREFHNLEDARKAGEAFCRRLGWAGIQTDSPPRLGHMR